MVSLDFSRRFSFDTLDARGCYVALEQSISDIQATHHYPESLAKLLNEFAVSAVLLRDSVKMDGSLTIQYRSPDAISMIIADCSSDNNVRAICEFDSEKLVSNETISLTSLSNRATLTITINPEHGQRYQGVVAIEHESLAECLQNYFLRSEQLPSRFILAASQEKAVGMCLHALPEQDSEIVAILKDDWHRLELLFNTCATDELLSTPVEQMLTRLFHEESCRIHPPKDVKFACDCSKERSAGAIKSLGVAEVQTMMREQDVVSMDCHFCFQRYEFDQTALQSMLDELIAKH